MLDDRITGSNRKYLILRSGSDCMSLPPLESVNKRSG